MHFAIAWRSAYTCEVKPPPLQRRRMSTPANLSWPRMSSGSYTCQGRRSLQTQFYFDRSGIPMAARWRHSLSRRFHRARAAKAWPLARSQRSAQHSAQQPRHTGPDILAPASSISSLLCSRGARSSRKQLLLRVWVQGRAAYHFQRAAAARERDDAGKAHDEHAPELGPEDCRVSRRICRS